MPVGSFTVGTIALTRSPQVTSARNVDPQLDDPDWAHREGIVAFAGYPLLVDSNLVGVMTIFSRRDFSASALETMAAVADAVAVGIERKRAEAELARHTRDLQDAHDTQRRDAQQLAMLVDQLRVAQKHAEAATRAKSDFLASMSHELRTPLNAIILYSELLQEVAEDQGQQSFITDLQRIQSAGKHLLELINGILDLSKIEAGKMALSLETFDDPDDGRRAARHGRSARPEEQQRPDGELRCRRRHDDGGSDEDTSDPAQPSQQRGQVHARRHDRAGRPAPRRRRAPIDRVHGHGYRCRHDAGADVEDLRPVHAGRRHDDAQVRRDRARVSRSCRVSVSSWADRSPSTAGRTSDRASRSACPWRSCRRLAEAPVLSGESAA